MIIQNKSVAVLCVDPSSPFNRGALGGLCPKAIEITDVLKTASFDYIIIETVSVGQNEVEIAALADVTVVVYVPEAGDEVQTIKAGLTEIADIFYGKQS